MIHGKSNCLAVNGLNLYNNHKNILEELTYGVVSNIKRLMGAMDKNKKFFI